MSSYPTKSVVVSPPPTHVATDEPIRMAARLCLCFLQQATAIHSHGFKAYGVFTAPAGGSPFRPVDVRFFDAHHNCRNSPQHRPAFEAQGSYFRAHADAGFVVDGQDLARVERTVAAAGQMIVAPFHSHRRQPPNFSAIDYRLHTPWFAWHLVLGLRNPATPELQPFRVDKGLDEFGIHAADDREGSEQAYQGDNVRPLELVVEGTDAELEAVVAALGLYSPAGQC